MRSSIDHVAGFLPCQSLPGLEFNQVHKTRVRRKAIDTRLVFLVELLLLELMSSGCRPVDLVPGHLGNRSHKASKGARPCFTRPLSFREQNVSLLDHLLAEVVDPKVFGFWKIRISYFILYERLQIQTFWQSWQTYTARFQQVLS